MKSLRSEVAGLLALPPLLRIVPMRLVQYVAGHRNVSPHELTELLTEPQLNAWYHSRGEENSERGMIHHPRGAHR